MRPLRGLQEHRVATREESGVLGFPSRPYHYRKMGPPPRPEAVVGEAPRQEPRGGTLRPWSDSRSRRPKASCHPEGRGCGPHSNLLKPCPERPAHTRPALSPRRAPALGCWGFRSCSPRAQSLRPPGSRGQARSLWGTELRCSKTCAIFPDRGANLQLLSRRAGSLLDTPRPQGSPPRTLWPQQERSLNFPWLLAL